MKFSLKKHEEINSDARIDPFYHYNIYVLYVFQFVEFGHISIDKSLCKGSLFEEKDIENGCQGQRY